MRLNVLDIDKFVAVNKLGEVKNPIFLSGDGRPTEEGIFSYEVFGRVGSPERGKLWGFINLHNRFLHPAVYKACKQLDRKFQFIIDQSRYVTVDRNGKLVDDDNGWTGLAGLYENWSKIKWGEADKYGDKQNRIDMLRLLDRDLAFVTKWPIIPAMYRDIDTKSVTAGRVKEIPPINDLYIKLMSLAPERDTGLSFMNGNRRYRAQEMLLEIHVNLLNLTAKKRGIIQDKLLGKYVDYAVRSVIAAPNMRKNPHLPIAEQEIPFGYVGIPLYLVINMFQPFFIKELDDLMKELKVSEVRSYIDIDKNGNKVAKNFEVTDRIRAQINDELYQKWINRFLRSQPDRISPLYIEFNNGEFIRFPFMDGGLGRPTTLTDIFFVAAKRIVANKTCVWTRYPVEDFRATHFCKIAIMTTENTITKKVGSVTYTDYPSIETLDNKDIDWIDALIMNNAYLAAAGGDYDGDTIKVIGLFTAEANKQAETRIKDVSNIVDAQVKASRKLGNEAVNTLFCLTR